MAATEVRIDRCGPEDAAVVAAIARETFRETYADQTSERDMRDHLAHAYARERIAAELAEPDSEFFLARVGDEVVGYLKVNRGGAQTEPRGPTGFEIESLYVSKSSQRRGVGVLLVERALDEARRVGAEHVWLGVWERNAPARRFWQRMGFAECGSHPFRFGTVEHTDVTMRRELG